MPYKYTYICNFLAFSLTSSPLCCLAAEVQTAELFQSLDANQDGKLEQTEIDAQHARMFARLLSTSDTNDNGHLSAEEFHQGLQPQRPAKPLVEKVGSEFPGTDALLLLLVKMDANGDRTIHLDEVPKPFRPVFNRIEERLGGDRDGKLLPNEIFQIAPGLSEIALRFTEQLGIDVELELALLPEKQWLALQQLLEGNRRGEPLADRAQALQMFRRLDTDNNGQVTDAEIPDGFAGRFERLMLRADKNKDNQLSEKELLAISRRMREFEANRMSPEQLDGAVKHFLKRFDRNGDSKLSREEVPQRMAKRFQQLDQDGNDQLDRNEMGLVVELLRRMRGPEARTIRKKFSAQKSSRK